ncbi:unnamed protein product [Toxocara canis]|uniref:Thioredoxin-like_fold domain-containing protein n=1 Tax=Toxocara canis TaxID=6265 RepID=A0A183VD75_TOXCA|nr:unnamed protein product [Toxocara canis]
MELKPRPVFSKLAFDCDDTALPIVWVNGQRMQHIYRRLGVGELKPDSSKESSQGWSQSQFSLEDRAGAEAEPVSIKVKQESKLKLCYLESGFARTNLQKPHITLTHIDALSNSNEANVIRHVASSLWSALLIIGFI